LQEGEMLLKENKITITQKSKDLDQYSLSDLIKQKPNKKILFLFPVKLWYHSIFVNKGEKPVVYSNNQAHYTQEKMTRYLKSLGYFNGEIKIKEHINKRKNKITVEYIVIPHQAYLVRNYSYSIEDSAISYLLEKHRGKKIIKSGDNYNEYKIDKERNRIAKILNNEGYYTFTRDYVSFRVDTNLNSHQADIQVIINNDAEGNKHYPYHFRNLSLSIKTNPYQEHFTDTLRYFFKNKERLVMDSISIYFNKPLKIKPKAIAKNLYFHSGDLYNLSHLKKSIQRLNRLTIAKRINVEINNIDSIRQLDAHIDFIKRPLHYYTIEAQGTNRGGDLGLGAYINYSNRNLFRNSELLNLKIKGAFEFQHIINDSLELNDNLFKSSTIEWGANASIYFPFLLAPVSQTRYFLMINPQSVIDLGYNYQKRLDYQRTVSYLTLGYKFGTGQGLNWGVNLLDINFVKVDITDDFRQRLELQPLRIKDLYTDHLIFAMKLNMNYGKTSEKRKRNSFYFRSDIESSGNLLQGISMMMNTKAVNQEENYKTIFGIRFAQYLKWSNDFRYYLNINKENSLAFRSFIGIGFPLKNSSFLPLERAYFGGGANGMRAWKLRYLGPGSYAGNDTRIESFGDLMLEGNFEYRFPIYRFLYGALFYDIGNIWLINDNYTYPDGAFSFQSFLPELAMDAGFGIRFDFSYFMFRLDLAQKIKDPALPAGNRWVFGSQEWFRPVLNFGIGYPF
jgi:outer membrane protein assembly factor BamA